MMGLIKMGQNDPDDAHSILDMKQNDVTPWVTIDMVKVDKSSDNDKYKFSMTSSLLDFSEEGFVCLPTTAESTEETDPVIENEDCMDTLSNCESVMGPGEEDDEVIDEMDECKVCNRIVLKHVDHDCIVSCQYAAVYCTECDSSFKNPINIKPLRSTIRFKCSTCSKEFSEVFHLFEHPCGGQKSRAVRCGVCTKHLMTPSGAHWRKRTCERELACWVCSRVTFSKLELVRHLLVHRDRPFKCERCERAFFLLSTLRMHMRLDHSKYMPKKTFPCNVCEKAFSSKTTLNTHMKKHENETEIMSLSGRNTRVGPTEVLKCDICNKTFSEKSNLRAHVKKHPGEEVFKLDQRKEEFSESSSDTHSEEELRVRKKSIPQKRKQYRKKSNIKCSVCGNIIRGKAFECDTCGEVVCSKLHLDYHTPSHCDFDKPYECDICERRFFLKSTLKAHLRAEHKEEC